MKNLMRTLITTIAIVCVSAFSGGVQAQVEKPSVAKLTIMEKMVHRRAIEAAVWSIPLSNFHAMREGHFTHEGAGFNTVFYNSKIQNWKLQTTTNNNTTPYVMIFWNLEKDGPVVVEIPPAIKGVGLFGTLMDAWQRPLEDVGAKGLDRGQGAKYLMVPPHYQGEYPEGYVMLKQATNNGYTALRPIIPDTSSDNLIKAEAYVKQIKVYPLSQANNPPKTKFVDVYDQHVDGRLKFDARYFESLNEIVQEEIIEEQDLAMMGLLKGIGIIKGRAYNPDKRRIEILDDAAHDAHEYFKERYFNSGINLSFWGKKRNWSVLFPEACTNSQFTYRFSNFIDVDARVGFYAFFSSAKYWNLFNAPTFYLLANTDGDNQQLNGSQNYKLTIPKDVPIKQFWSAIAYTLEDATWFDHQPKAGVASSDQGVKTNADGTVDIYLGPKSPKGLEANWIPTTADEDYFIYFRLYGPTQAFFEKQWVLNNIEKANF